ncbi:MAG TPA: AI-2E family transporter [Bryobacteraceae bacterium]|jgi:predicted PurR-regulated permease PerM/CheY-like chemotaxis protein|nr:AI-2E family transporter [Bryobacteraceae bacterium]
MASATDALAAMPMSPLNIRSKTPLGLSVLVPLSTMALVIVALHFGQEVLIPFALALLLTFLLSPPVAGLQKLKLGRIPSVLLVLTLAFSGLGGIFWLGTTQLADIVTKLPQYQENINRKIEALQNPAGSALGRAIHSIQQLGNDLSHSKAEETPEGRPATDGTTTAETNSLPPVPVQVLKPNPSFLDSLTFIGTSMAHVLATAAAVVIFTVFMLIQRSDLRNRFFQIVGPGHLSVTTTALDDAARRVSQYLLSQSIVNGAYGLLLGAGFFWIGVPNAAFWGVLAAILRFIPYIGTLIAGGCPLLLALAVFNGWEKPLLVLALFAAVELTVSWAIEPWLYGSNTGVSSLAILVSAAFWTLLWGPIGLVLSTPLTVCLLVLGRYVPPLKFLDALLGDKAALAPEAAYYQRLLAMDDEEAQEIAEDWLKEKTLCELYDSMLIPALSLAEQDRHAHVLDEEREDFIYQNTKILIEDLGEPTSTADAPIDSQLSIICIPARDAADELIGLMLAQVLRQIGYDTVTVRHGPVEDMLQSLQQRHADVLFVSALPPLALGQSRTLCRRARRTNPDLKILLGLWGSIPDMEKIQERFGAGTVDSVVTSLKQAEIEVRLLSGAPKSQPRNRMPSDPGSGDITSPIPVQATMKLDS